MCECLCGAIKGDINLAVGDAIVTVDAYTGCRDCAPLFGIDVSVFTEEGAREWLRGAMIERATPNEYGGPNGGRAACFEIFSVDDLAESALLLGFRVPSADYDDMRDFMTDFGLKWVQSAAQLCRMRHAKEKP